MSRSISATSNPVSVTSNPWAGSSSISSPSSTARSSRSHPACSAMRLSAISYSAKNSVGRKFFRILPSSLKRRRMPPVGQKARAPSPKRLYPSGPLLLDPIIACIETKLMRKGLAYAVHLVVGLSLRKRQQFSFKSGQKVCPHGKKHITAFKFCLVDVESADFIAFDGNKPHRSVESNALEFLGECDPGGSVLDQYVLRSIFLRKSDRCRFQARILVAPASEVH